MAILSSAVSAGDIALASQYNNLRIDLLTGDITIAGVKTFSSAPIFSAGIASLLITNELAVDATKKVGLDGISPTTYLIESSDNIAKLFTGDAEAMQWHAGETIVGPGADLSVYAGKKIFLDAAASAGVHTYIYQSSDGVVDLFTNAAQAMQWHAGATVVGPAADLVVYAGKKLFFDGAAGAGGNTYIIEPSGDELDFVLGGSVQLRIDGNGIAPGDNESMMWDVVIVSLDGTTPDSVGYVFDENKVYALQCCAHSTSTVVTMGNYNTAISSYNKVSLEGDSFSIIYGAAYGASDALQILLHYIA